MTYLTPKEACEQVCPLITYCVNPIQVQNDNQPAMHDHIACMGPACKIGWRWGPEAKKRYFVTEPGLPERWIDFDPREFGVYQNAEVRIEQDERTGFCGHFGRPE